MIALYKRCIGNSRNKYCLFKLLNYVNSKIWMLWLLLVIRQKRNWFWLLYGVSFNCYIQEDALYHNEKKFDVFWRYWILLWMFRLVLKLIHEFKILWCDCKKVSILIRNKVSDVELISNSWSKINVTSQKLMTSSLYTNLKTNLIQQRKHIFYTLNWTTWHKMIG